MPFDAEQFLQNTVNKRGSTQRLNIPEGEYPGTVHKLAAKTVTTKNGERVILEVTWKIADESVVAATKREQNTAKQSVWLDMKDGQLDLSEGMNTQLNRLRETLGQNEEGATWNPNAMLTLGALCTVIHRIDGDNIYDEIKHVRAA